MVLPENIKPEPTLGDILVRKEFNQNVPSPDPEVAELKERCAALIDWLFDKATLGEVAMCGTYTGTPINHRHTNRLVTFRNIMDNHHIYEAIKAIEQASMVGTKYLTSETYHPKPEVE